MSDTDQTQADGDGSAGRGHIVPENTQQMYWRLVYFIFGALASGVLL